MRRRARFSLLASSAAVLAAVPFALADSPDRARTETPTQANAERMLEEGQRTFRFDTFGGEAFWGGQLRLHEAIAGEANGGSGMGLSPSGAIALGLKVDVAALPRELAASPASSRASACERSASNARCATPRLTTAWHAASASGWTAGRIAISTSARSWRSLPT
jgi:hypothetical protein